MNGEETRDLVSIWLMEAGLESLDENGRACLEHDDKLDCLVEVPQEGGRFVLTAPFFFLDVASMSQVAEAALTSNMHQTETRGGTLALDGGTQLLVFTIGFPCAELSYPDFANILSNFMETALLLKDKLELVGKNADEGASAGDNLLAPGGNPYLPESGDAPKANAGSESALASYVLLNRV
ncbi:MAG: CesT family type III secretion system chaperone [Candidatus Methylacidiphilales bacterium]|nr:CesT family type III secretion system chaperone [Candidatus Methylacidiphilales bacterium]